MRTRCSLQLLHCTPQASGCAAMCWKIVVSLTLTQSQYVCMLCPPFSHNLQSPLQDRHRVSSRTKLSSLQLVCSEALKCLDDRSASVHKDCFMAARLSAAARARLHFVGDNAIHKSPVHSTPQVHALCLQITPAPRQQLGATTASIAWQHNIDHETCQRIDRSPGSSHHTLTAYCLAGLMLPCPSMHAGCQMCRAAHAAWLAAAVGCTSRGMSRSLRRNGPRGQLSLL